MSLSSFYGGGVDSALKGAYFALPVDCMVYGRGEHVFRRIFLETRMLQWGAKRNVYLPGCTKTLPEVLSRLGVSKAFIITGSSLREKTPVVKDLETVLGSAHAGTYSGVRQHAYVSFDSI